MKIEIDQDRISNAITETATQALESSLAGFQIQQAIAAVVSKEVAEGAIAEAIKQAAQSIDTAALTQKLAEELQRATIKASVAILQEGLLNTVCKLRGLPEYGDSGKAERQRLRAELFHS